MSRFDRVSARVAARANARFGDPCHWKQDGERAQAARIRVEADLPEFDTDEFHESSLRGVVPKRLLSARPASGDRVEILDGPWIGQYVVETAIDFSAQEYSCTLRPSSAA